jgi:hypothetical protein
MARHSGSSACGVTPQDASRAAYHTRTPERAPYRGGKRGVPWLHITGGIRYSMPHSMRALQWSESVGGLSLRGLPGALHRREMALSLATSSPTPALWGLALVSTFALVIAFTGHRSAHAGPALAWAARSHAVGVARGGTRPARAWASVVFLVPSSPLRYTRRCRALTKEGEIAAADSERALRRKATFEHDPERYTYAEEAHEGDNHEHPEDS